MAPIISVDIPQTVKNKGSSYKAIIIELMKIEHKINI